MHDRCLCSYLFFVADASRGRTSWEAGVSREFYSRNVLTTLFSNLLRGENNFPENRFEFEPCATEKLDLRARSFNLPLAVAGRMRI